MTTKTTATQLDRAHIQSRVIEANLEHLRVALLGTDTDIGDRLVPIAHAFGEYVSRLGDARALAESAEGIAAGGEGVTHEPVNSDRDPASSASASRRNRS